MDYHPLLLDSSNFRAIMMTRFALLATLAALALPFAAAAQTTCMFEGEAFQFKGKWVAEKSSECLGTAMLRVYQDADDSADSDALTVVSVPEAGNYKVWVRSRDYAVTSRPRSFTLSIDGTELAEVGRHGHEGFYWEEAGAIQLPRKNVLLRLHDSGCYYGRCDAILITTDSSLDPNTLSNSQIARWRRSPVSMPFTTAAAAELAPDLTVQSGYTTLATASNSDIRISFVRLTSGEIVSKTDFFASGSWRRFANSAEDNRLALISSAEARTVNYNAFYPAWDKSTASRIMEFEGTKYKVTADGDLGNPYFTGELFEPRPDMVTKTDGSTIKVTYDCQGRGSLTVYWNVPEQGRHINVRAVYKPAEDTWCSIVLHPFKGLAESNVSNVLMPPSFQYRRLPSAGQTLFSSMMTQCVAMVETPMTFGKVTAFVAPDLTDMGDRWGSGDYSSHGFSLRNSRGDLQPVAISPLPGMSDSKIKGGRLCEARFVMGVVPDDWSAALCEVSAEVFGVTDYRRQDSASLSATYGNILKLIDNDEFSGWHAPMKGFWDIECNGNTDPTVVQSAPLALVGASYLSGDADFYRRRALPTIEFILSRSGFRAPAARLGQFAPLASQFPTSLFEGLNTLGGDINPWLSELALPEGELRTANGYFSSVTPMRQALSAWRLTGDGSWLARAEAEAEGCLDAIYSTDSNPFAPGTFYHSQVYPDWQSMLEIGSLTGDERYIEAAAYGAASTIAGVRTWPAVPQGSMTLHPGGKFDGVSTIWWKGTEQFRLGFPRTDGDAPEHEADAWRVSPVGLGIEQPATYFSRTSGRNDSPVFMNNWAPALLRLAGETGNGLYETYARNALLGRADSYPGYYAAGYTDINLSPSFPYVGPDISSIYYHHVPAYMAAVQDFLVSEMMVRGNGEVSFPAARQEGFVWFANDIYGRATGTLFGQEAQLWIPRGGAAVSSASLNILSAKGQGKLFLMLASEEDAECAFDVKLADEVAAMIYHPTAVVRYADGSDDTVALSDGSLKVGLAPKGFCVVELEGEFALDEIPPLADGMRVLDSASAAGDIYIYRIRSPFGWDTVYGFASGSRAGMSVEVECNGERKTVSAAPYEWSFGEYGYDTPVKITVKVNDGVEHSPLYSEFTEMSGVPTSEKITIGNEGRAVRKGVYNLTGQKVTGPLAPGFYIIDGQKRVVK